MRIYYVFLALTFAGLLLKNLLPISELHPIYQFVTEPGRWQSIVQNDSGREYILQNAVLITDELKRRKINAFRIYEKSDMNGYLSSYIHVEAFPIMESASAKFVIYTRASKSSVLKNKCQILFETPDQEAGIADCHLADKSI